LHLQLPLAGLGVLGEDIQNEGCAVYHQAVQPFFQIALLAGAKLVIKDDNLGAGLALE